AVEAQHEPSAEGEHGRGVADAAETEDRRPPGDGPAGGGRGVAALARVARIVGAGVGVVAGDRGSADAGAAGRVADPARAARPARAVAGARAGAATCHAEVDGRAGVVVVALGAVRLAGADRVTGLVADRPDERRHHRLAALLEVGGEASHLSPRAV